jgi:HSP20 family molecular chaperone IbpA
LVERWNRRLTTSSEPQSSPSPALLIIIVLGTLKIKGITLTAKLPETLQEDIDITLVDDLLTIKGEKNYFYTHYVFSTPSII